MTTKNNIFQEHLSEWLKAAKDKKKRGEMMRNICFVSGVHPKSVPRSFRRVQMRVSGEKERRGRQEYYTPDVICALKDVWDVASEPCAENLKSLVSEYVRILTRDGNWKHGDEATEKLLAMSLGTMKKRVAKFIRKRFVAHGKSTTKAGAIHTLIPVRSGPWNKASVGTEQIDTLNAVYDVLTPYLNHFVASRRIVSKERVGARWKVTREKIAKTPYERALERKDVTKDAKAGLRQKHEILNPLIMKREIERRLQKVFILQKRHGTPKLTE